jgi:glycosyltransferase involved in cell wall biosynthesis
MNNRASIEFSIIIPAWNRPDLLAGCLQALDNMVYPRDAFEIIIVDDGSSFTLSSVVESFCDCLPLRFFRQANAGPAAARNHGARQARGKYLVFTDDDCRPTADWLQSLSSRMKSSPESAISGQRLNALDNNIFSMASECITEVVCAYFNDPSGQAGFVSTSNLSLPADRFWEIGGFEESFRTAEDRDLGQRWRERGYSVLYAPEVVVYHLHSLTFATLWKRYFNIGRGARQFANSGATRGQPRPHPDLSFYKALLCYPLSRRKNRNAVLLSGLIGLAQVANIMGYLRETIKDSLSNV